MRRLMSLVRLNISRRLYACVILGTLLLVSILTFNAYQEGKKALIRGKLDHLVSLREAQAVAVKQYFKSIEDLQEILAEDQFVHQAITNLAQAFKQVTQEAQSLGLRVEEEKLLAHYRQDYLPRIKKDVPGAEVPASARELLPRSAAGKLLQYLYIHEDFNRFPVGEKHKLDSLGLSLSYDRFHRAYHPFFRDFLEKFSLYDIFLIDLQGNVVYTVFKEKDFATNLKDGPYRHSGLAKAFRQALNLPAGKSALVDFSPYLPSYNLPAAFIATPIYQGDQKIGVLCFQFPVDKLNAIMSFNRKWKAVGLGETGEVYLVGPDFLMRNDSRFLDEMSGLVKKVGTTIGVLKVDTEGVREALAGQKGARIIKDYRGVKVLSAYAPLDLPGGLRWAILAEKDYREVLQPIHRLAFLMIAVGAVVGLAVLFPLMWVVRGISRRLNQLVEDIRGIDTDLTRQVSLTSLNCSEITGCGQTECPCYGRKSHCWYEVGSFSDDVHCPKIIKGIYQSCRECRVFKEAVVTEIDEVATSVNTLLLRIRRLVARVLEQGQKVAEGAKSLLSVSEQLASGAVESQRQAEEISRVAEETSQNVHSVAAAMEEMTTAMSEVAQHTAEGSQAAQQATTQATQAQEVLTHLAEASSKISEVSRLIGSIADQTNLLALNATIEAARAGEAGKGFTVVANEVKELARQTGDSVSEIDEMVKHLQQGASEALHAMNQIHEVILKVAELSNNIAAAMEEQTAITNEVSANTQKVNEEMGELSRMSQAIAAAGEQTAQGSEQVRQVATELRRLSDELMEILGRFRV